MQNKLMAIKLVWLTATTIMCLLCAWRPVIAEAVSTDELIVKNWKPDTMYYVMYGRGQTTPGFSATIIGVETWFKLRAIPHYRLTNGVLMATLTSPATFDDLPIVEFQGQRIKPLDNSVASFAAHFEKLGVAPESRELVLDMANVDPEVTGYFDRIINDLFYGCIMYDRHKSLDFMAHDQAVMEGAIPKLIKAAAERERGQNPTNNLFETLAQEAKLKAQELVLSVDPKIRKKAMSLVFERVVATLKVQLDQYKFPIYDEKTRTWSATQPFSECSDDFVAGHLKAALHRIAQQLRKHAKMDTSRKFYLYGNKPSPTDALLFGYLVQYFETPSNIPMLRQYYAGIKANPMHPDRILFRFYEQIKSEWGFAGTMMSWDKLKQRPWPLNWEPVDYMGDKYNGPFTLDKFGHNDIHYYSEEEMRAFLPVMFDPSNVHTYPEFIQNMFGKQMEQTVLQKPFPSIWPLPLMQMPGIAGIDGLRKDIDALLNEGGLESVGERKKAKKAMDYLLAAHLCQGKLVIEDAFDYGKCGPKFIRMAREELKREFQDREIFQARTELSGTYMGKTIDMEKLRVAMHMLAYQSIVHHNEELMEPVFQQMAIKFAEKINAYNDAMEVNNKQEA